MNDRASVAAIILAAGLSRRFGAAADGSKLLALLAGKPLIRHVAEAAAASRARPMIVVLGPAAEKMKAALSDLAADYVRNDDPAAGLSRSLAVGLAAVPANCAGALILLADMPCISAEMIDQIIDAFWVAPVRPRAVVPVYAGRRGNPVLLGRAIFEDALMIDGDQGARRLLAARSAGILECPIANAAIEIDVDTRTSLAHLARHFDGG